MTVKELMGSLVDTNEVVALWGQFSNNDFYDNIYTTARMWKGMGHQIPDNFMSWNVVGIKGFIPESLIEADTINIVIHP